jgi:hypothetical protein
MSGVVFAGSVSVAGGEGRGCPGGTGLVMDVGRVYFGGAGAGEAVDWPSASMGVAINSIRREKLISSRVLLNSLVIHVSVIGLFARGE